MGRPSSYKEEYAKQAYKLCLLGATDKEIASIFGVAESTFNLWKQQHEDFSESLKAGKDEADAIISTKLYHRAKGYSCEETVVATYQGQITDTKTIIKHYPPDTTAAIFWLKNRQPKKWRDKQELEVTTNTIKVEITE